MSITAARPFKGRQYSGEVILTAVRWYLRYPLAYEHVAELLAERGLAVDASCIWRWVQAYAAELNKRCRPHLKATNKSYRVDETYIKVKGQHMRTLICIDKREEAKGAVRLQRSGDGSSILFRHGQTNAAGAVERA
jgi:transposase-like protein